MKWLDVEDWRKRVKNLRSGKLGITKQRAYYLIAKKRVKTPTGRDATRVPKVGNGIEVRSDAVIQEGWQARLDQKKSK